MQIDRLPANKLVINNKIFYKHCHQGSKCCKATGWQCGEENAHFNKYAMSQ